MIRVAPAAVAGGTSSEPRVAPGSARQVGLLNTLVLRAVGWKAGGVTPHVFTTLARSPQLFRRWLVFASALMPGGALPRPDTEWVILRVAHASRCPYEWAHHERIGRSVGLTGADIEAARGPAEPHWERRRLALARAVDELLTTCSMAPETFADLGLHLETEQLIEFCLLVGHYRMLAMTINALGVQLEPSTAR